MPKSDNDSDFTLDDHFAGKRAVMRGVFDVLIAKLRQELAFRYRIGKSYIGLEHTLVFAAVHVQTRKIIVEFVARRVFRHPRIRKVVECGRNRWAYFVDVARAEDIDEPLIDWIRQSYE